LQGEALTCFKCSAAMVVIAFITDLPEKQAGSHGSLARVFFLNLPSRPPEIKPAQLEEEWPLDEWRDDEGEGEGGNTPPGSASRGPPHLGEKIF